MSLARGYEPVAKLDTNIMASRQALSKMGFPTSEIDKIDAVTKERKYFVKRSQQVAKLSKKGKLESDKGGLAPPKNLVCDICGNITGLGVIKLTSPEQETKIPSAWAPFAMKKILEPNDYRAYVVLPSGIVISYYNRKIYVVCGTCRVVLRLRNTESGILIHNKTEGTGYGFVDLDKVEKLIQMYKAQISVGNRIDPMIDFSVAVEMDKFWEEQPEKNP
jgi:hypothetical protein